MSRFQFHSNLESIFETTLENPRVRESETSNFQVYKSMRLKVTASTLIRRDEFSRSYLLLCVSVNESRDESPTILGARNLNAVLISVVIAADLPCSSDTNYA